MKASINGSIGIKEKVTQLKPKRLLKALQTTFQIFFLYLRYSYVFIPLLLPSSSIDFPCRILVIVHHLQPHELARHAWTLAQWLVFPLFSCYYNYALFITHVVNGSWMFASIFLYFTQCALFLQSSFYSKTTDWLRVSFVQCVVHVSLIFSMWNQDFSKLE